VLSDCRSDSRVHDIAKRSEADNYLMHISVGQIFDDGGDKHNQEIGVVIKKERAHQIADPFENEVFILSEVDCVDVSEGGGIAQHLDVQCSNEMLFGLFGCELLLGQFGLED